MAKRIKPEQIARAKRGGKHAADQPRTGDGRTSSYKPDGVSFRTAGGSEVGKTSWVARLLRGGK